MALWPYEATKDLSGPQRRQRFEDTFGSCPRRRAPRRRHARRVVSRARGPRPAGSVQLRRPTTTTRSTRSHSVMDELYRPHLGKPLCNVPAPPGAAATDIADISSGVLRAVRKLGVRAETYRMRDIYRSGRFDEPIRAVLGHPEEITRDRSRPHRVGEAAGLVPVAGRLRELRAHRHDTGRLVGRRDGRVLVRARPRRMGDRLRSPGEGVAVRRECEAPVEARVGGEVESVRRHRRRRGQGSQHAWAARATWPTPWRERCSRSSRRSTFRTSSS